MLSLGTGAAVASRALWLAGCGAGEAPIQTSDTFKRFHVSVFEDPDSARDGRVACLPDYPPPFRREGKRNPHYLPVFILVHRRFIKRCVAGS